MPALALPTPRVLTDAVRILACPERFSPTLVALARLARRTANGTPARQLPPRPPRKAVA